MTRLSSPEVSKLLKEWNQGDEEALNRLIPLVYDELHKIARNHLRRERAGHTLQTTDVVHEIYLRFLPRKNPNWQDRGHFLAAAIQLTRRILVDHWRKRRLRPLLVTLDENLKKADLKGIDIVDLDDALTSLEKNSPRMARVVEMLFFGGLTIPETASCLHISESTVKRDWKAARAWIGRELKRK